MNKSLRCVVFSISAVVCLGLLDSSFGASGQPKNITNAILTNRSANCGEYVNAYASFVTDLQRGEKRGGKVRLFSSAAIAIYKNDNAG